MSTETVFEPCILRPVQFWRHDDARALAILNACRDEIRVRYGVPRAEPFASLGCLLDRPRSFFVGLESGDQVIACGGAIGVSVDMAEMKSVYVVPYHRGQGIGRRMVAMVENWAARRLFKVMRLETGDRQPEARRLYESMGYRRIPNYGEHAGRDDQFCYEKELSNR